MQDCFINTKYFFCEIIKNNKIDNDTGKEYLKTHPTPIENDIAKQLRKKQIIIIKYILFFSFK